MEYWYGVPHGSAGTASSRYGPRQRARARSSAGGVYSTARPSSCVGMRPTSSRKVSTAPRNRRAWVSATCTLEVSTRLNRRGPTRLAIRPMMTRTTSISSRVKPAFGRGVRIRTPCNMPVGSDWDIVDAGDRQDDRGHDDADHDSDDDDRQRLDQL